jgi:hypothetical protein
MFLVTSVEGAVSIPIAEIKYYGGYGNTPPPNALRIALGVGSSAPCSLPDYLCFKNSVGFDMAYPLGTTNVAIELDLMTTDMIEIMRVLQDGINNDIHFGVIRVDSWGETPTIGATGSELDEIDGINAPPDLYGTTINGSSGIVVHKLG